MASLSDLPELVRDSKLQTYVHGHDTIHVRPSARRHVSKHEKWSMIEVIGHGGGGIVWLQRKTEGLGSVGLRAVKGIQTSADVNTTSISRRFVRELEASAKFSQEKYAEHFVKSYGWYDAPGWLYITMEYCPNGDLGTYLRSKKVLPEDQVQDIAGQILEGLSLMHSEGFAHRDLKPSNILIVSKPPEDEWWVKLCDLGLSRRSGDASGFTTVRGTPEFMAPETIGAPFIGDPALADPVKADMWCFGETISRALTGRTTFDMSSLLEYQRAQIAFPQQGLRAANVSQAGINFINRLMMRLPSERPGTELQDVWLRTHTDFDVDYAASPHTGIGNNPLTHQSLTSNVTAQHTQASGQWTATMPLLEPHHSDQSTQASGTWTSTVTGPFERTHSSDHPTVPTIGAGHSQGAPPPQREPSPSGMEFHDPPSRPHSRLKVWTPSDSDHHGLQKTERDLVSGSHPIDVSDKQPAEGIEGSQRTPTSPSHNESQSEATDGKIGTMSKARVLVTSQEDKVMAEPQPPRARLHGLRMAPTQPSPQAVLGGEADGQIPGHQDMGGKSIAGENARLIKGVSAEKGQQEEILPESLKNTQPDKKPFPKKLTIFEQLSAVEKSRMSERQRPEARESKAAKLNDLRRFSENFKVNSAVPVDIIPILSVAAQARLEGRERSPSVGTAGTSRNSDSSAANDAPSRPSLTTPPSVSGSTLRRSWADVAKVAKPSVDKKFIQYKTAPIITIGADGTASHPLGRPLTVNTAIPVGQNAIENETQATTVRDSKGKRNTKRRPAKQRSNTLMKPTYPRG